ncbi:MAG: Gfo/Idh/MocA family protein [Bacteroidales bacterium]
MSRRRDESGQPGIEDVGRREFIRTGVGVGLGAALALGGTRDAAAAATSPLLDFKVPPIDPVRIGYVGVGGMGSAHVRNLLKIEGVQIRAVCDIVPEKVARVQQWVVEAGQQKPEGYSRGPTDFRRLCERDDIDLVYNATPWEWHVPICVAAMQAGKHAATEVPAATTIDECWQLVETAEKTRRHCVMMENCCYDRPEMLCLNLVKKGLLGEILHAEAGYLHDLRGLKFSNEGEGLWRLAHSIKRNANLYPTHGLGPVSQCMDINRGDAFAYLVSMSSPSRGLNLWAAKQFGAQSAQARQRYASGDVNVSLIHTFLGKVVTLYHDTNTPRPYSRIHHVQGTAGIFEKYPDRVYIEGRSKNDEWDTLDKYAEFDHPLWTTQADKARGAGHGGMDYIEDYRLIDALRNGRPLDMDVYDAAAWSVVTPLSEQSVAGKSRPVDFPNFTRGGWKTARKLQVMDVAGT